MERIDHYLAVALGELGVVVVVDERPVLRQAYERRVDAMQALLAFDVSAIPLEADLDPSRAPTT